MASFATFHNCKLLPAFDNWSITWLPFYIDSRRFQTERVGYWWPASNQTILEKLLWEHRWPCVCGGLLWRDQAQGVQWNSSVTSLRRKSAECALTCICKQARLDLRIRCWKRKTIRILLILNFLDNEYFDFDGY